MAKVLSIIIPMYNSKAYIQKCLNSLLLTEQSMEKLDILVVNDGSTDGCEHLTRDYCTQYTDSIRLLNKANHGHGSAINYAVPFCRGKYLKVLDADDWFLTENLEKFLKFLEHAPETDIVLSAYQTYNIKEKHYQLIHTGHEQGALTMDELVRHWSVFKQVCCFHAITYQTDFYRHLSCKLPEDVYYDDAFFTAIPAYQAKNIGIFDLPLYVYRIGDNSQSVSPENRVKRMDQLETVIWSMHGARDKTVDTYNQIYFYRRLTSAIADYLITACLRHPVRHSGRRLARKFMKKLLRCSHILFKYSYRKFLLLYMLSLLGVNETFFNQCMLTMQKRKPEGVPM